MAVNVLFITLDQFRGDCLSAAGHPVVRTPNLDRLAAAGVRLSRHYSQAAPCAPGRASLYTGHVPDEPPGRRQRHAARRPLRQHRPRRPASRLPTGAVRLHGPGRRPAHRRRTRRPAAGDIRGRPARVRRRARPRRRPGPVGAVARRASATTRRRATNSCWPPRASGRPSTACRPSSPIDAVEWIGRQDGPWFAHLSYLRPHPPYAAAGQWSQRLLTRRRRAADRAGRASDIRCTKAPSAARRRGARRTRRRCARCARSTSG